MATNDPWLSARMADRATIGRAESELHTAVNAAVEEYIRAVASALLGSASGRATMANGDPPELDNYPDESVWRRAVDRHIRPVVRRIFARAYSNNATTADGADAAADAHTEGLASRLSGFHRNVYERIRRRINAARQRNAPPEDIRQGVEDLTRPQEWQGQALTITRTETMAALNSGAMDGAKDEEEATGTQWEKHWQATHDQRVRDDHRQADGQTRPLDEPFLVGGARLRFPGDPQGPPGQVINCRCSVRYTQADNTALTAATPPKEATVPATTTAPEHPPTQVDSEGRWRGVLGVMGEWSADRRMLAEPEGGQPVRTRPLPLPMLVQPELAPGHDKAELGLARLDRIWVEGRKLMGEGSIDLSDPRGVRLAQKIAGRYMRFVSLDVDDATARQVCLDADGGIAPQCDPTNPEQPVGQVYSDWRVMGVTILAHPAFPDAHIAMVNDAAITAAADPTGPRVVTDDSEPAQNCVRQGTGPDGETVWVPADCAEEGAVPANADGTGPATEPGETTEPEPQREEGEPPAPDGDSDGDGVAEEPPTDESIPQDGDTEQRCVLEDAEAEGGWREVPCDTPGAVPANADATGPAEDVVDATDDAQGDATFQEEGEEGEPTDDTSQAASPTHAGLAIKATDTGRVLLIQRALDDDDPASGTWEFPGGEIEQGEDPQQAALREFQEETGATLPDNARIEPGWTSENGVYQAFIALVDTEGDVPINQPSEDRQVMNPDDPDGDGIEVAAWWSLDELPDMGSLREEVRATPWDELRRAGTDPTPTPAATPDNGDAQPEQTSLAVDTDLPWAPRDRAWDGAAAKSRVAEWATSGTGEDATFDPARMTRAFLVVDGPAENLGSYKFGVADIVDGQLRLVWNGVVAANAALSGARSETTIPADKKSAAQTRVRTLYQRAARAFDDPSIVEDSDSDNLATQPPADCKPCQGLAITASAGVGIQAPGWTPPAAFFAEPDMPEPVNFTVDPDTGRISGLLAHWGTCHIGFQDNCILPPPSATNYSHFNDRAVQTEEGPIYAGVITMGTGHADLSLSQRQAAAHYDNTGTMAALVRAGENEHGIWLAGVCIPFLSEEDRLRLSFSRVSGDWRQVRGNVELIAALAVNRPGFPIPQQRTGEGGQPFALVAAGLMPDTEPTTQPPSLEAQVEQVTLRVLDELAHQEQKRSRMAAATHTISSFRNKIRRDRAMETIQQVRGEFPRVRIPREDLDFAKRWEEKDQEFQNWVEQQGGLPPYIRRISRRLRQRGMTESRAIATAVNVVKKMCASGDTNWPGTQRVNARSRTQACAAVARWEAMKARARAS